MRRPHLLLTLAAACWGVGTVISKVAVESLAPVLLLIVQLSVSVLLLSVAVARRGAGRPTVNRGTLLGALNPGLSYALGLAGLSMIAASTSVLIWATEPALIAVLAAVVLRERFDRRLAVALGLALAGVLLVVYSGGGDSQLAGVLLTVAAVAACAVYTILARLWAVDGTTVTVTLGQQAVALVFALVVSLALTLGGQLPLHGPLPLSDVPMSAWGAAVVSGAVYYAAAFWLYLAGLRDVPASVAGLFLTLVPVFGVLAALTIGERLTPRQVLGATFVVTAVALTTVQQERTRRRRTDDRAA